MTEDLLDYWLRIITPLFPTNAWIVSNQFNGGHLILIDWKLDNDPQQPNKRSRKIQITIEEEAIDNYLDKSRAERDVSDIKMRQWLSERYNQFDPEHNARTSRSVATERWRISRNVLNS